MSYNYVDAMKDDVLDWIHCNDGTDYFKLSDFEDRDELEEYLRDTLWTEDSVTGNASGSYTFNRWKARDFVLDNIEDLSEATYEFGVDDATVGEKFLEENWEWMDVTIRCYYLGIAISEALDEMGIPEV